MAPGMAHREVGIITVWHFSILVTPLQVHYITLCDTLQHFL